MKAQQAAKVAASSGAQSSKASLSSQPKVLPKPPEGSQETAFDLPVETKINYQQNNPKKIGSQTHYRYEIYKKSKTVKDAKDKGSTAADFREDRKKGYVQILK